MGSRDSGPLGHRQTDPRCRGGEWDPQREDQVSEDQQGKWLDGRRPPLDDNTEQGDSRGR